MIPESQSPAHALAAALVAAIVVAGCAQQRPPIDRVQANVIRKADLQGTWYYLQTVVDMPYSAAFTVVGEQSYLEKIEWEIQEDYLLARRSFEWIAGSEPDGLNGPETERGAVIAAYTIESHFDVRREYNTTTGEEVNVLVENSEDRYWYEREYMRVDWSLNHITDTDVLSLARIFDGVETRAEPVSHYVQDPTHPDAPVFEYDEETEELRYFDVVNRLFVEPTTVYDEWWGEIPSCWLYENYHLDCVGAEIAVRHSFLRVDESRDYQPWDYSGDRMARFGYFVVERAGYDPHYGVVDPARHRFINRHNIWVASHRRDEEGELLPCSDDGECADLPGSVCDLDLARARRMAEGACTIPYREWEIRPIAYHLSWNFPEELAVDIEHVVADWNGLFVETVGSLRELECERVVGGDCAAERDREDAREILVLCHNPVTEEDHAACGPAGTSARIGDLRYSIFGWVSDAHVAAPLGYGPAGVDPETGEMINGSVFVYGPEVEYLAAYGRDLLALLNGDLSQDDISTGLNVQRVAERLGRAGSERTGRPADDHAIRIDGRDVERIARAMDFSWLGESRDGRRVLPRPRPRSLGEALERRAVARRNVAWRGGFGRGDGAGHALLEGLRGSPIEELMTGPEMRLAAGLDPRGPADASALDAASPLRGMSLRGRRALRQAERRLHGDRCWMRSEFADDGLLGLARAIQRAADGGAGTLEWYGQSYEIVGSDGSVDYEAVREMIRHPVTESTVSHELGHTLGLRHNFMGSYDALNYHHRYWELRDDGDMRPRAWDPLSEEELDGRIREYQTSSVMDYGNNFIVTDAVGVGSYDRAAIKMGYGDLVEVFTEAPDAHEVAWVHFMQLWEYPVTLREDSFYEGYDVTAYEYTDLPAVMGGIDALESRADVPYAELVPDPDLAAEGVYDPLVDGEGRPAVPFRFCSDEVADLDPTCMAYDAGADPYETTQSIIDTYWHYYLFNNFRRERIGFEIDPYYWRILERYFWKLQWANQAYVLYQADFHEMFGDEIGDFDTRPDGFGAWTLATGAAYQLLTRVVTTPEPGDYVLYTLADGTDAYLLDWWYEPDLSIDPYEGRYLETTWDWDQGYYWFDAVERVGFFYDKIIALQVLVDPETSFVGEDEASDIRSYALSFYNSFGPSLTGLVGGLLSGDLGNVAPRPGTDDQLLYPDPLELELGDMRGTPVDPNAGFTIQLYAAAYAMAMIPQTYSQAFTNEARIWVRGAAEEVEVDPAYLIEFYEPVSGMTYVAASYPDEDDRETGVGARMLLHAQALADAEEWSELAFFVDSIDVVRSLSWEYGMALY